MSCLYIVGIGPGGKEDMTFRAFTALENSTAIYGYTRYVELVKEILPDQTYVSTGMRSEVDRCEQAIEACMADKNAAISVVSSGDAGIYGMTSLIYELIEFKGYEGAFEVEVIPGVSAAASCGAILGAPCANDFVTLSLSDQLTPWPVIERRLHAAAGGDFVIVLYNVRSKARPQHLDRAVEIIGQYRDVDTTICAWVKNAGRRDQAVGESSLRDLAREPIDMLTTVFIGNSETIFCCNKMINPRGYADKYLLD